MHVIMLKEQLHVHLPRALLLCLLACWAALAGASQALVPEVATPAPLGSGQHHLSKTADGRLILSWVEQKEKVRRLRFSIREAGKWSTPRTVVTVDNLLVLPRVLGLSDGALAAVWVVAPGHGHQNKLYVSRSTDGGTHWSEPLQPYPANARIYGAISAAPLKAGRLAVAWVDVRHWEQDKYAQIWAAVVDWHGKPGSAILLDSMTCSCCATDTVAQADGSGVWTAYRNRTKEEVRDISLVHWSQDGPSEKAIVHHDHFVIAGCPHNGPAMARRGGLTMVSWFTVADRKPRVLTAFSHKGVGHFGEPITVDRNANGYVNSLLLKDGSALVAWRDRAGPVEKLQLAQVRQDGTVAGPVTVYRGAFPGWPSYYIGLAKVDETVYVAWTDPKPQRVRLAKVPLSSLTGRAAHNGLVAGESATPAHRQGKKAAAVAGNGSHANQADLVAVLVKQLDISAAQARGGAGAVFQAIKSLADPQKFKALSQSVSGVSRLLRAAPEVNEAAYLQVNASFKALNIAPGIGKQLIAMVVDYVSAHGGMTHAKANSYRYSITRSITHAYAR